MKNKLFAFTVALASTLTLGHPALAGWLSYADDALRLLSRPSVRSSADDVVRLVSKPYFNPKIGKKVATFAVAGAGTAGTLIYYNLIVDCNNRVASWGNNQAGYQPVNFNSVQNRFCR